MTRVFFGKGGSGGGLSVTSVCTVAVFGDVSGFSAQLQTPAFLILVVFSIMNYCFWFGFAGLATSNNRNLVLILLSIELLLLGLSGFFVVFTFYHLLTVGHLYVVVLMTLAGAESALGLALMVLVYRLVNSLNLNARVLTSLKH